MGIVIALLGAVILCALGWAVIQVRGQQGRIGRRLDTRAREAGPAGGRGTRAPAFDLAELGGGHVSLAGLLARAEPTLLVFVDPRCGPCYELLPDVAGWQRVYHDRLTIALLSAGSADDNRSLTSEYGIHTVLLQTEQLPDRPPEVARAFGVDQLPAAVLVGPDGIRHDDAAFGAPAVRQLAADALGLAMPEAPARQFAAVRPGQPAPALGRPDLDGNLVRLAQTGEPTLLIFFSPGCTACERLLPEIKIWEAWRLGWRPVVVSRGPVALNRATGLSSPIVLDDDRSVAAAFGITGTPAAVVLDARGRVAAEVARGAHGVRALIAGRLAALGHR